MKKMTLLAASIALVLSGCGSSSDDNNDLPLTELEPSTPSEESTTTPLIPLEPATPVTFTIKAIDGYLEYAKVYAVDAADCVLTDDGAGGLEVNPDIAEATLVGTTDADGALTLQGDALKYKEMALCVVAEEGVTIDSSRGVVTDEFVLSAVAGSEVISPLTTLVAARIADAADDGVVLSQADAEEEVLALFADLEGVDGELLFGDFIAAQVGESTKLAQAIEKMAQALVDNSIDLPEYAMESLAQTLNEALNNEHVLWGDYAPVYTAGSGFDDNHRPYLKNSVDEAALQELTVKQGVALDLKSKLDESHFDDQEDTLNSDDVTYTQVNTLSSRELVATTEFTAAGVITTDAYVGDYTFHAFATDDDDAKSDPVVMKVSVTSDGVAPVAGSVAAINTELAALKLAEGKTHASAALTADLSDVFTDADTDAANNSLEYKILLANGNEATDIDVTPGLNIAVNGTSGVLTVEGTPLVGGEFKVIVTATDGVYAPVQAEITIPVEVTSDVSALAGLLEGSIPSNDVIYTHTVGEALAAGTDSAYVDGNYYDSTALAADPVEATETYRIDGNTINYTTIANGNVAGVDYVAYASAKQAIAITDAEGSSAFSLLTDSELHDGSIVAAAWTDAAISNGDVWYLVNVDGTVNKYVFTNGAATADKKVTITVDAFNSIIPEADAQVLWSLSSTANTLTIDSADTYKLLIDDNKLMSVVDIASSDTLALFTTDADLAKRLAAIADFEANL